eukprot:CAMPEP_0115676634 /NCGR_PEP_ID=MMETSP0272-20121206/54796_1 /TAXON_ID=71861 /ORGANISM="Scrippsiella trochoidea, Strain CCMP3099" /LENGTH=359 /DNA_ID=CAMNT_0003115697 /DNA_START=94 /DNA_END=1171 /DNA_ORIENTATION=-
MASQARALLTMHTLVASSNSPPLPALSSVASHTAPSTLASRASSRSLTRRNSQRRTAASLAACAHQPRPSHGRLGRHTRTSAAEPRSLDFSSVAISSFSSSSPLSSSTPNRWTTEVSANIGLHQLLLLSPLLSTHVTHAFLHFPAQGLKVILFLDFFHIALTPITNELRTFFHRVLQLARLGELRLVFLQVPDDPHATFDLTISVHDFDVIDLNADENLQAIHVAPPLDGLPSHHLKAFYACLQNASKVDLQNEHPHREGGAHTHVSRATHGGVLAANHHISGAHAAVEQGMPAAEDVVKFGPHHVVNAEGQEKQLTFFGHLPQGVHARSTLIGHTPAPLRQARVLGRAHLGQAPRQLP